MNRKKITKAALSGLVAVTMVPAMAAPLVANAEGNDAVETSDASTKKDVIMKVRFVDENGAFISGGDQFLPEGVQNLSILAQYVPQGYEMTESGDFMVVEGGSRDVTVKKVTSDVIMNIQFVDKAGGFIAGGDYTLPEGIQNYSILQQYVPEGYKMTVSGDFTVVEGGSEKVTVESIYDGTILNFVFVDANGNEVGGGDVIVDTDKNGIFNWSEVQDIVPAGYELTLSGDQFVADYIGGNNTIAVNKVYKASIIKLVFVDENGENVGGGDYFVDEDGDGIFNYSELTLPEGYELIVTGDEFVDTEKTYEIVLNKEIEGTIINVVYVDEEGNNLGGGDFFVDPDDDGIANYSELDLPEGYELIVTGDFFVTPGKSYTITLHKITEEETAAATLVVRYVDQENGNEVVLEKTYDDQVGPVGETATYIEDVVVPEGYELVQDIEGIAADVEYGQTKVMYVFVTKTAQEPTQPGDEEEPNTPAEGTEESEQTDGTDTGVAMSLAGVFGTMSAALAGMVALLRRKQK